MWVCRAAVASVGVRWFSPARAARVAAESSFCAADAEEVIACAGAADDATFARVSCFDTGISACSVLAVTRGPLLADDGEEAGTGSAAAAATAATAGVAGGAGGGRSSRRGAGGRVHASIAPNCHKASAARPCRTIDVAIARLAVRAREGAPRRAGGSRAGRSAADMRWRIAARWCRLLPVTAEAQLHAARIAELEKRRVRGFVMGRREGGAIDVDRIGGIADDAGEIPLRPAIADAQVEQR